MEGGGAFWAIFKNQISVITGTFNYLLWKTLFTIMIFQVLLDRQENKTEGKLHFYWEIELG